MLRSLPFRLRRRTTAAAQPAARERPAHAHRSAGWAWVCPSKTHLSFPNRQHLLNRFQVTPNDMAQEYFICANQASHGDGLRNADAGSFYPASAVGSSSAEGRNSLRTGAGVVETLRSSAQPPVRRFGLKPKGSSHKKPRSGRGLGSAADFATALRVARWSSSFLSRSPAGRRGTAPTGDESRNPTPHFLQETFVPTVGLSPRYGYPGRN